MLYLLSKFLKAFCLIKVWWTFDLWFMATHEVMRALWDSSKGSGQRAGCFLFKICIYYL